MTQKKLTAENISSRLQEQTLTTKWLLAQLRENGMILHRTTLTKALTGARVSKRYIEILAECDKILTIYENSLIAIDAGKEGARKE